MTTLARLFGAHRRHRRRYRRQPFLCPAPPQTDYDPRAWFERTYARRSDWFKGGRWVRRPKSDVPQA